MSNFMGRNAWIYIPAVRDDKGVLKYETSEACVRIPTPSVSAIHVEIETDKWADGC